MAYLRVSLVFLGMASVTAAAAHWGYQGHSELPANWYLDSPVCAGQQQSPIDVVCSDAQFAPVSGPTISLLSWGASTLRNNGHATKWNPGSGVVTLTSPNLNGVYQLAQVHFHWGSRRGDGSEHAINGQKADLEMHMVFFNSKFSSSHEAVQNNQSNNLAVVGVLFQQGSLGNPLLSPIVSRLGAVVAPGLSVRAPFLNLASLDTSRVFEYSGSLTTPGCNEIVHWIVLPQMQSISAYQLAQFRQLKFEDGASLEDNFRPLQLLNGRTVNRNFASLLCGVVSN